MDDRMRVYVDIRVENLRGKLQTSFTVPSKEWLELTEAEKQAEVERIAKRYISVQFTEVL